MTGRRPPLSPFLPFFAGLRLTQTHYPAGVQSIRGQSAPTVGFRRIGAPGRLGDVLRQKVVEHGADRRDHRERYRPRSARPPCARGRRREQIRAQARSRDLPADHLVGGAANRGSQQAQQCLERTVAHDENGRRFDGESDKSRDLLELLFEPYGRFPFKPSSAWR